MNVILRFAGIIIWALWAITGAAADLGKAGEEAEKLRTEGSYALAGEAYARIDLSALSPDQKRWVEFRLAEMKARSAASSQQPDDSAVKKAEEELKRFMADETMPDRAWAEAQETFGDLQRRPGISNLGTAWSFYERALDFWAGSTNRSLAAEKYWSILRKAAEPPQVEPMWYYGSYGTHLPLAVLDNALKIARTPEEEARAHFMIAMTLRSMGGEWDQRFRIPLEFERALKLKKETRWYDDSLYFYGEWMSSNGRAVQDENGNWRMEPDFEKALELFRRLTAEFRKGETPWYDDAQNRIREITRVDVNVMVGNVFLPESEIEFHLSWRNVPEVEFTLFRVDLTQDLSLRAQNSEWLEGFNLGRAREIKSWKKTLDQKRPHVPGSEVIRLPDKLSPGAYLLVAKAGTAASRELLLVTDASCVLQTFGRKAQVYACDSKTGAPLSQASVVIWERFYNQNTWSWTRHAKEADEQGLARFDLHGGSSQSSLFVMAKLDARQAFCSGGSYLMPEREPFNNWKIYAFPDKPAYRPGEKVQWKILARRQRGESLTTPAGEKILFRLLDPRGAEIGKENVTLNEFGSGWGSFDLKSEMPLGEYQAVFLTSDGRGEIGRAALFRMEEYKLPEFKVAIRTPEENGRKKTFLLGESLEVEVAADYYFGGPVANATAEIVVHQAPYYHIWAEPREFDWFYAAGSSRLRRHDPGQVVQRETVKTDSAGKAKFTVKTPFGGGMDLEFRIEARVTDASRREIVASDTVRVGSQRFYVFPKPAHLIHRPHDKVEVEFRLADANEQPVAGEGTVRITRDYWFEVWLAPDGREVKGGELQTLQRAAIFPPVPPPGQKPWLLKFRGYQQDQVLTRTVKAGTNGLANVTFTPEREGYYRVAWRTDEEIVPGRIASRPIRAETTVWAATTQAADLGYHSGGLEILVDKDTFRAGQKAVVMLNAPSNDRYVWLTTSGADLLDSRLIHLTGSVKLLEIDVDEKHVPNFFINGTMVADQQLFTDQKEIVVPPLKNFLTVEVQSDRREYRPGEKGVLRVRTRDDSGKAVSAEVALSVFDESVSYIGRDLAGDPRQFFFGTKRTPLLTTSSSFNYRPYRKVLSREEREMVEMDRNDLSKDVRSFGESRERVALQSAAAPASPLLMKSGRFASNAADAVGLRDMAVAGAAFNFAKEESAAAAPSEAPVQVRTDFRSAVFWEPDLRTDENGEAEVSFKYPDTLTSWKAVARAATERNQFGTDDEITRTKQPLTVRLQAPRFFLAGDIVTISAIINNNTAERLTVSPEIATAGIEVSDQRRSAVKIDAGGEARVDWIVRPRVPGEVNLKVAGRAGPLSDAMEKSFPVYEHGIEKFLSVAGKSRTNEVLATLSLPAERKAGATRLTVQVTPSLAVTMLDALPYLIEYPYGCTEQTMSRFLPATITVKTLKDLGLDPEAVMSRIFGGIEQGSIGKTHPGGKKDLAKLSEMTDQGLARLYNFQHADGGWGWWKEGESDRFMSAYVLWGLNLGRTAGLDINADVIRRAASFLNQALIEAERDYDLQAWMLHALATGKERNFTAEEQTSFENLWENRDRLNAYSRALFALAAHDFGKAEQAQTLVRNLANGIKRDDAPSHSILTGGKASAKDSMPTAHWGDDGINWHWSEGGVEATAFGLRALLAIDPKNELVDPVANWLIKNRRGAQWSNTRDTAIVLLALNDYLRISREVEGQLGYEVFVNGASLGERTVSGPEVFRAPEKFVAPENVIKDGTNEIRIVRRSGNAPIYFAAECTFFSVEEPIAPAGHELFVHRRYYKLTPVPTLLKGYTYGKQEMHSGDRVASGDRLETVLTIETKNNYEYLLFEDLKPAGVEAVEVRSGESLLAQRVQSSRGEKSFVAQETFAPSGDRRIVQPVPGESRPVYQELRDRKIALFIDKLPEGFWEIRYETRAEIPGEFHVLPVLAQAMYVPEIRGNSAETKILIQDSERKESHE